MWKHTRLSERKMPSLGYHMFGLWKKRIIGQRCAPTKMKTRKDSSKQLTFDAVQQQRDNRTEIFTELQIRPPDRPGTHTLKAKVDTGAEGNTLPLRTFHRMFPDKVDDLGQPISGSTKTELTILTAYNGSSIRQHSPVSI